MYVDDRTADRMLGFRGFGAGKSGDDADGEGTGAGAPDPKALAKAARDRADAWKKQQAANRVAAKTRAAQFISTANEAALRSLIATLGVQLRDAQSHAIDTGNSVALTLQRLNRAPGVSTSAAYAQALIDDADAQAAVLDLSDQLQLAMDVLDRLLKAKDKAAKDGGGKPSGQVNVNVAPANIEITDVLKPTGGGGGGETGGGGGAENLYYKGGSKDVQALARDVKSVANALSSLARDVDSLRSVVQGLAARGGGRSEEVQVDARLDKILPMAKAIALIDDTLAQVVKVQIEQAKAIADLARARGSDMKGLFAGMANLRMRRTSPRAADAVLDAEAAME